MEIGQVIREYRKKKNITQEEMANRLGVTAPAVNKWENGNSQPDIMLLAPIARLLNITPDILLSFEEELREEEINNIVYQINEKFKSESYEEVFKWSKEKIDQYPNCEQLIWQVALILDAWRLTKKVPDSEKYEDYINSCYERALESQDENIRTRAADSLFGFYSRKEEYEKAEEYLNYFSNQNPERKRKQAFIYSKTNKIKEAYKTYEELLFSGYGMMSMVFQNMYILAMKDKDKEKAYKLVEKQRDLAEVFEMGDYYKESCKLDWVTAEKDVVETIATMEKMLASANKILDFTKSSLYNHMEFKEIEEDFIAEMHKNLLLAFGDKETYDYMIGNKRWQELVNGNTDIIGN